MKIKLLVLVFSMVLLLCLAACNAGDDNETTATAVDTTAAETASKTESETTADETADDTTADVIGGGNDTTAESTDADGTTETDTETTTETEEITTEHVCEFGDWTVTVEPTCTADGKKVRKCACGEEEVEVLKAFGHTEVIDEAVDPTCTETGLTEGKHCSACETVLVVQVVIKANGHSFGDWTVTVEPTCTADGMKVRKCACGEEEVEVLKAFGHTEVIDEAVDPTCTETGLTEGKHCSACETVLVVQVVIKANGHSFGDWTVTVEPTCTADGNKVRKCACGEEEVEVLKAFGHTEVIDEAVDPTCTKNGLTEGKHCSVCYLAIVVQEIIPAAHDYVNGVCTVCNEVKPSEGLAYTYLAQTDSYEVSGLGTCTSIDISIPSIHNGKPVTGIGIEAFWRVGKNIRSVIIPNSVTSIGEYAFSGCSNLTEITIPDSVVSIGKFAFGGCSGLTSVVISNSVKVIGEGVFQRCTNLVNVTIPNGVTSIGRQSFYHCTKLKSVYIPNSVISIEEMAFSECTNLNNVTIPDSVVTIGRLAFDKCSALASVTIGSGVTIIGDYAFASCSSLRSISIPEGVASIGVHTFSRCTSLVSITIPKSVKSIGNYAFYLSDRLATVYYGGTKQEWNEIAVGSNNAPLATANIHCAS